MSVSTAPNDAGTQTQHRLVTGTGVGQSAFTAIRTSSLHGRLVALYILAMPLIAGVPRGKFFPMVRLTELLQVGLTGLAVTLVAREYSQGRRWRFQIMPIDWAVAAVAFFGSVVPLFSMLARAENVGLGEIVAAFPLLKYFLLWVLVRCSVRTAADVQTVLLAAVASALAIAALAVPEGLGIGPTGAITRELITDGVARTSEGRALTTLGSSLATGAFVTLCAAIAFGFAVTKRSILALAATGFMMLGVIATGQTTSALAVVVVLTTVAWHYKVLLKSAALGVPCLLGIGLLLAPIIETRLADTASRSLIPQSWSIRWVNVSELYWPQVRSGGWLLGVDTETIVVPPDTWRDEVYLESGYLWKLWVGGLPLLIAFVVFLFVAWRTLSVPRGESFEVARVAALGAIVFMALFNIIDPHSTLRGGADVFYVMVPLALAYQPLTAPCRRRAGAMGLIWAPAGESISPTARIQLGEIGGSLLATNGWSLVSPRQGVDRGIDIAVRDQGETIGEARMYFEPNGSGLDAILLHSVRAVDEQARSLVWRGVFICAASMRVKSIMLPPRSNGLVELSRSEIGDLERTASQLERNRRAEAPPFAAADRPASATTVPEGVRLEPSPAITLPRRIIDIAVSAGSLLLFAPFAALIALVNVRSGNRSVLFRQMRIGAGGRPFRILKFRTMNNAASSDVHRASIEASLRSGIPDTKVEHDPRITPLGRLLRSWSVDEIPQLFNVLRGEMTLVGPRPSLLWETSMYEPRTRRRLQLTPGIAGLWQASGRGDIGTKEMLELDLDYADTASLAGDAKIVARTAVAVVTRKGAR